MCRPGGGWSPLRTARVRPPGPSIVISRRPPYWGPPPCLKTRDNFLPSLRPCSGSTPEGHGGGAVRLGDVPALAAEVVSRHPSADCIYSSRTHWKGPQTPSRPFLEPGRSPARDRGEEPLTPGPGRRGWTWPSAWRGRAGVRPTRRCGTRWCTQDIGLGIVRAAGEGHTAQDLSAPSPAQTLGGGPTQ